MNNNIKLVVFDWAGTTTDFGSQAPTRIFDKTFSQMGLHFTTEEINAPMGMEKKSAYPHDAFHRKGNGALDIPVSPELD